MGRGKRRSRVLVGLPSWTPNHLPPCVRPGGGRGDDDAQAKDGQGLCIIDGGCLINDAEDGNVQTTTGLVPYKARDKSYAGGQPKDGIILLGGTTMKTEVLKVPTVNGG
jgi:hypothetical protein